MSVVIVIPVFNDWIAANRLLGELDRELRRTDRTADVLLVDDGSTEPPSFPSRAEPFGLRVHVLHLRRNLGHQRAIAIALAYVEAQMLCDTVVVMDADGEDRPEDVPRLLEAVDRNLSTRIVFAARARRSESVLFVLMYTLFKIAHRALTGERIRVGNFSAIPRRLLSRLVAVAELWNHYAAAVFKARLPFETIDTTRGRRYGGRSKMDFVGHVTHGLSAMSVFGETIGVRLLAATVAAAGLAVALGLFVLWAPVVSGAAVPLWAPYIAGTMLLLLFEAVAVSLSFVFIILSARGASTFLPLRDYQYFISAVDEIAAFDPRGQAQR